MNILEVKEITKSYHKAGKEYPVLSNVSLEVGQAEMVAIMGASGSGKTSLLNIIAGLLKADSGEIISKGENIKEMTKSEMAKYRRNTIGIVFQDFNLIDSLNIKENILLPMALEHFSQEEQQERLDEVMKVLGIEELEGKEVTEISGGQKQRVAIARALVNQPAFILADEPTGNLDRQSAKEVMHYLQKLKQELGTSILIVTHDIFTAGCCDRILILDDGVIRKEIIREQNQEKFQNNIMDAFSEVVMGGRQYDVL